MNYHFCANKLSLWMNRVYDVFQNFLSISTQTCAFDGISIKQLPEMVSKVCAIDDSDMKSQKKNTMASPESPTIANHP